MNLRRFFTWLCLGILMAPVFGHALTAFEPRPKVRELIWLREHAQTKFGRPYDHNAYPHAGAPGGPCDAVDDPLVREIILQWGSRVGKTIWSLWTEQFWADTAPGPMLDATVDEKLAKEDVADQYAMLDFNRRLAGQLRPEHLRKDDCIRLRDCKIHVGWSRSNSTLSGKDIRYGRAGEIDKWIHFGASSETATEAHPLKLFDDRFKNYPSHKRIKESTPAVKGRSHIERLRLSGTNCQYYVPCPHCRHYQVLRLGDGTSPGGIRWEKLANGKHDKDLARRTAYYECEACRKKIFDHHRAVMMRCGVWCPEGCRVDDKKAAKITGLAAMLNVRGSDGASTEPIGEHLTDRYQWRGWSHASWITGTPLHDGPEASYQLSSLYALSLGWGNVAAEFVSCKDRPQELRNFINQWLAQTWEVRTRQQTWEQLGIRLIDPEIPRRVLPRWASLATVGADRQQDRYVWVVEAWGPGQRSHTVDYGEALTLEDLERLVILNDFQHADGGPPLRPCYTLIDSGYKPRGVAQFCLRLIRRGIKALPSKGSSTAMSSDFDVTTLGKNTSLPGMKQCLLDTTRSQDWIEEQLHSLERGDPGSASLFAGSLADHQDFLEQLLNDQAIQTPSGGEGWEKVDETIPNDYRDCRRYAYGGMLLDRRGRPIPSREVSLAQRSVVASQPAFTGPDGQPFLITERRSF